MSIPITQCPPSIFDYPFLFISAIVIDLKLYLILVLLYLAANGIRFFSSFMFAGQLLIFSGEIFIEIFGIFLFLLLSYVFFFNSQYQKDQRNYSHIK